MPDMPSAHNEIPAAYVVRCACDPSPDGTGGETVVDHIRLFPLRGDVRWTYRVHEQILPALRKVNVPVRWTNVIVRHTGYVDTALRCGSAGPWCNVTGENQPRPSDHGDGSKACAVPISFPASTSGIYGQLTWRTGMKNRRVVKHEQALRDLAMRSEYIRQHNPRAALRFLDVAEATIRILFQKTRIGLSTTPLVPVFMPAKLKWLMTRLTGSSKLCPGRSNRLQRRLTAPRAYRKRSKSLPRLSSISTCLPLDC
jgi:hypothetical protein